MLNRQPTPVAPTTAQGRAFAAHIEEHMKPTKTTPITVKLTAYNMGPATREDDFDAWHTFVCDHIDQALGFEVADVEQYAFTGGPSRDFVIGGTEEQREAIRSWLAHEGWDAFCSEHGAEAA